MKTLSKLLPLTVFASLLIVLNSCNSNELRLCFETNNKMPKVMERVTFTADCSEGVDLYHWNFGDGIDTVTRVSKVEHTFAQEGYYTVTLHDTKQQIVSHCPPGGSGNVASTTVEVMP